MSNVRGLGDYRGGSGGSGGRRPGSGPNVRSLGDYSGDGDDSDDDHHELYTGGEKSGMVVKGPPKEKPDQSVDGLFDNASRLGAQAGSAEDLARARGEGTGNQAFTGAMRTLDGRTVENEAPAPDATAPQAHTITFYRNGVFTVNDGPARAIQDPENREFMDAIGRGLCPPELNPTNAAVPVEVNLLRKEEDYKEPEVPNFTSFQGTGLKLTANDGAGGSSAAAAPETPAGEWQGIDESQPATSLQLRLADGSRMVAKFNLSHTIGDIRRFIKASRPDMTSAYQLMTAFPSAALTDNSQTIEAAGLQNAVIIQK